MRDFRMRKPGAEDNDDESSDVVMRGWEMEEAREVYESATSAGPAVLGFASIVGLLALTLAVTLGLALGLVVLGVGLALTPLVLGAARAAIVARRRLHRLEQETLERHESEPPS